jgi:hypothetical protein
MRKKLVTSFIAYGILVFSVITAISLLLSMSVPGTIIPLKINFPLIAFISFILFIVVVGLRFRDLSQNVQRFQDEYPAIEIKPIIEKDQFYLQVTNIGEVAATFVANLKIASKRAKESISSELNEYHGSWKQSNFRESKIMKGQSDKIRIAELQTTNFPIVAIHLRAYVYENEFKVTREIALQSYFPLAVVTHADGKSGPMIRPEYELDVSISSDPCMKVCPMQKKYLLSISGLAEKDSLVQQATN